MQRASDVRCLLLVLLAASCAAPERTRTTSLAPALVPTGEGGEVWIFTSASAARYAPGPRNEYREHRASAPPPPRGAGQPRGAALDLREGRACVPYERSLALVDIANAQVEYAPSSLDAPIEAVAIHGELVGVVAGGEVAVIDFYTKEPVVEPASLSSWEPPFGGGGRLLYAYPHSRDELSLVWFEEPGFGSDSQGLVERRSRAGGEWRTRGDVAIRGGMMTYLDACASAGGALYLAGIREDYKKTPWNAGQLGTLEQILVVYRLDPDSRELRNVVWQPAEIRGDRGSQVSDVAVGQGLVALVESGNRLLVFREVPGNTGTASLEYDSRYDADIGIAWIAADRIAVSDGASTWVVDVGR